MAEVIKAGVIGDPVLFDGLDDGRPTTDDVGEPSDLSLITYHSVVCRPSSVVQPVE
jgi:hypothetical protein